MAVLGVRFTRNRRDKLAQALWILNWVSVLSGLVLISLGVYLSLEMRKRREVMASEGSTSVPNMLVAVGAIACGINLLGGKICHDCWDNKFSRWRLLMLPYIICTFFFTFCILVGALMCYSMRGALEESLYLGLQRAMRFYKDTDTPGRCFLKKTMDELHIEFRCCGNNGFRDWFETQWISSRYLDMNSKEVQDRLKSNVDGKYLLDGIPFSCCNLNSPRPCIQFQLTNNSAHYNYDYLTEELNHWTTGCRQALLDHYTQIMQSIGLSVLIIWLFEISVLIGVRYLQTAMENVQLQGDPDSESEGWLLQNDFVEKAKTNFNIIKNLHKVDQISTISGVEDPNMDINIAEYGPNNIPPKIIPTAS
ncbi:photoreceptor outer segment membrane glycoprotein 2-like [Pristis pectinata]|uniref:photoreceptor outer segment membrane glycoprotein 2-like n=1 Tax=Pristis pectinata TaxID=685728 RepID=UPI00223C96EA|nr:photoreceptor outer segment membrane glycoprotein 2-like [Pristis pectinata]